MPQPPERRLALVTGSASGIGAAVARRLARDGYAVVAHGRRVRDDASSLLADLGAIDYIAADLADETQARRLVAEVLARHGRLDVLVNNAGISGSSVGDPDGLEGWERVIAVNQTSVFLGTKLAAEEMAQTGGGSIVNDHDGTDGWDRIIAINQNSVFYGTRRAAAEMMKSGGGSIVNIS
ncbi:MAG TPA: SDR family oxidoreductase, partial [Vineibacter sp.]|nr:SDR family oxidoreductase [Vineibacter sp.]